MSDNDLIPATIHYCWFGGKPLPALAARCLDSWQRLMPDWTIKVWNEDNLPSELTMAKNLLDRKLYAFVSDFVRLHAVWKEGGIYLDTDVEAIRSLEPLRRNVQFIGFEREERVTDGVCGGVAGAPFFKACLDAVNRHYAVTTTPVLSPEVCTAVWKSRAWLDLTVYPAHTFYPYNPYDKAQPVKQLMISDIRPDTLAIHHWAKSWRLSLFARGRRYVNREISSFFARLKAKLSHV